VFTYLALPAMRTYQQYFQKVPMGSLELFSIAELCSKQSKAGSILNYNMSTIERREVVLQ
jgi:hypothetical protein